MTRFFRSVRSRWWALGTAWVLVSLLGFWGLTVAAGKVDGAPGRLIDRLYILPDFFGRNIKADTAQADWRIETARILGPLVAGLTFFQGLASIFGERIARLRARRHRGHYVVCGLGSKGQRLVADLREHGHKVVAIEIDSAVATGVAMSYPDLPVIVGDATDLAQLRVAGLASAAGIYVVCGDDGANAQIADRLREIVAGRSEPLLCTIHLRDDRLTGQLRIQSLRENIEELRLEYFSIYRGGAVVWVSEHLPRTSDHPDLGPHLLVLGLGQLGRSLVVRAAQMWADADRERERPLRVTIVDRRASGRFSGLLLDHPAVVERLRAETIDLDFVEPSAPAVLRLQWLLANDPPSSTFVAFDDDARSLSAALLVRSAITDPESTVIARTSNAAGLGVLVADDGLGGGLGITTFPLVERTCRVDVLSLGVTEQVARSLHATYLAEVAAGTRGGGERAVPWDQLSEEAKESNRDAADGIFETLRAVGCDLIPVRRWIDDRCGLSDDDIDAIARLEHERWRAEREAEGWHVGAERDAEARTNPLLVPWIDLPDSAKASARDSAEDLPMTLARAGFEIVRIDRRAAVATPGGTDRSAG